MTAPKDRFWAKVLFKEFIRHYRKMTDEQIINDVKNSMDDLDDLNDEGKSFGAKMVKWSTERKNQYPQASENGSRGGRPPTKDTPLPRNVDEVYDFARSKGIPSWTVINWWTINMEERNGHFKDGSPITNWKGALTNYWREERKKNESIGTEVSDG